MTDRARNRQRALEARISAVRNRSSRQSGRHDPTRPRSAGDDRDPTLPSLKGKRARTQTLRTGAVRAVRPGSVRRAVRGLFRWTARVVLAAAITAAAFAGGYGVWRFITSSPRFNIQEVVVDGELLHTPADDVVRRVNLIGVNIFSADLMAAAREVELLPWVGSAVLEREFPDRITVKVKEERAVALVSMGFLYLTDAEGRPFKRLLPRDTADLVVISGIERAGYEADPAGSHERIRAGLRIARDWERSAPAKRARLEEIVLDPVMGVTLYISPFDGPGPVPESAPGVGPGLSPRSIAVHIGHLPPQERLSRLPRVLDALRLRGVAAGRVHLDDPFNPDRVTVRLYHREETSEEDEVVVEERSIDAADSVAADGKKDS